MRGRWIARLAGRPRVGLPVASGRIARTPIMLCLGIGVVWGIGVVRGIRLVIVTVVTTTVLTGRHGASVSWLRSIRE